MSYGEYKNLFDKAQANGNYHMFIFDIKNSKSYGKELEMIEEISRKLILNLYCKLEKLEKENGKVILHRNKDFYNFFEKQGAISNGSLCEPFQFGDMFGLTIVRNSIDKGEIYQIFEKEKEKLNIYWEFHMLDGYYETDDYGEGCRKYYRGYCMQQLEELSKKLGKSRMSLIEIENFANEYNKTKVKGRSNK